MKKLICAITVLALMLSMTACKSHTHTMTPATCDTPATCSECGETEGEPLGHDWQAATCTTAAVCTKCGATNGTALGHDWMPMTCSAPKTCSICGETDGNATLLHSYDFTSCTTPAECIKCGAKDSKAPGHLVDEWTVTVEPTCSAFGEEEGVCTICGETVTQQVAKTAHTPGEPTIITEATYDTFGYQTTYCTECLAAIESKSYNLTDEQKVQWLKDNCQAYTFDEVARNASNYVGKYAVFTGEVIQAMDEGNLQALRVNVTREGTYYTYYVDTILVVYERAPGEGKILEDDIITIYGQLAGEQSYTSTVGALITLPSMMAYHIDIIG